MGKFDGRGWRVFGFFLFLLGAGLVLESRAVWYGMAVVGAGVVCFAWGIFSSTRRRGMGS